MKIRGILIGLLVVLYVLNSNSQELTGKWVLLNVTDFSNKVIENDLTFVELIFINSEKVEVIPNIKIQKDIIYECVYERFEDSIIIEFSYFKFKYKIEKLAFGTLILSNLGKKYYFRKYFNQNEIIDDTKDTFLLNISTIRYTVPMYKRDLYKHIIKHLIYEKKDTSSYNINIRFTIRKSGEIDNVKINADNTIKNEIVDIIQETNKK